MTSTTTTTKERAMHSRKGTSSIHPTTHNYAFNIRNYVNFSRLIIIVFTVMFTFGGTYYAFFLTPKYNATVYLSSKIYASLSANALSTDKVIPVDDKETSAPRQLALIQTPQLLRRLIDKLQLDYRIVSETGGIPASALAVTEFNVPSSLFNTSITLTAKDNSNYTLEIPHIDAVMEGKIGVKESFAIPNELPIELKVSKLPAQENSVFTLHKKPKGEVIEHLLDNLVFEADGTDAKLVTNIITITYTDMNPKSAADTVNALAEIAVNDSRDQEKELAGYTVGLMEIERNYILDVLNKTGEELSKLSTELAHVGFDEKVYGKLFADELTNLDQSIAQASADLAMAGQTVTDQHPKYQEAAAVYRSFLGQRDRYDRIIKESVAQGRNTMDLQRDLEVYTTLYQDASRNLQQFKARMEEPVGDLRIVELACIPDTPSSLSRPLIIGLSLIVGMICGYIVALVFD
jgi:tyrosine-protein kinase Etk/Wzc